MGRIYKPKRKKPDGSVWTSDKWYVEFINEHGKQVRKPASTNKRKSQDLLLELEGQAIRIRNGLEVRKVEAKLTGVLGLVEQFLADQKLHLAPKTHLGYQQDLDDLFTDATDRDPWLRVENVEDLTPKMIRTYQRKALEKMKPRTVNKKIRVLHAMLRWGVRQQIIKTNPIEGTKHLPDKPQVPLRALEESEIAKLLEHSPDGVGDIFELFIHTGLRKRELSTLRPKDVDLKVGVLTVRADISKNGRSRQVPLSRRAAEILESRINTKRPTEPIIQTIPSSSSRPRDMDFYEGCLSVFQRVCRAAKIDLAGLNIHSLRRTFCTRMIAKGASPGAVQRLLGHATMGITMEIYNRVRLGDLKDAVANLDD